MCIRDRAIVIGNVLGKYQLGISDVWISNRIDKISSVHLGPAASQMEKRGIRTDKGEVNRQIAADNKLLRCV